MTPRANALLKIGVFVACLIPLAMVLWDAFGDRLGANPIEELEHRTGAWGLRFVLIVLTMTPLRRLTGWVWPVRIRRMLGLFAFFYVCLHFLVFAVLDLTLDLGQLTEEIAERPYITVGFTAFVLLIPLAITSTNGWMRRLGRKWKRLHRLVYVTAVLGVVHFWWLVKADVREPLIYALILAGLFLFRIEGVLRRRFDGVRARVSQ